VYPGPDPRPGWAAQLSGLDIESGKRFGASFGELGVPERRRILEPHVRRAGSDFGRPGNTAHIAVALAHCLFNIPLAVWILEGFMSAVPKELDETAYVDGYSFPRFFVKIFIPTITAGIGVTAFFCFMFSWVEMLLAKTLTAVEAKPIAAVMTRTASSAGYELGLLAAAGTLTIIPGAIVIWFVRNYIARGFAMGRV